jgi:hypothetical protein
MHFQLSNGRKVGPDAEVTIVSNVRIPAREEGQEDTFEPQETNCAPGWLRTASPQELADARITALEDEPEPQWDSRYQQYSNGVVTDLPWEILKGRLLAHANSRKYEREIGGIVVEGVAVPTDDRAKLLIFGSTSLADNAEVRLVIGATDYGTRTGTQMKQLHAAIVTHFQRCIALYGDTIGKIEAGEVATYEDIDRIFA